MATTAIPELVSVNPATLQPVGAVPRTDPADVPHLVAAARAAQEQWSRLDAAARSTVLAQVARVVRSRADEIADEIVAETAKPRTEAIANELYSAVDHATWLAKHAPRILRDERIRFSQLRGSYTSRSASSPRSRRGTSRSQFRLHKWQQQWRPGTASCSSRRS